MLEEFAASKQPFFIYLGYAEAHVPLFATPEFQNVSLRGHYGDAVEQMDSSIGASIPTPYVILAPLSCSRACLALPCCAFLVVLSLQAPSWTRFARLAWMKTHTSCSRQVRGGS